MAGSPTGKYRGGTQIWNQQKIWHGFSRRSKNGTHAVIESKKRRAEQKYIGFMGDLED